MLFYGLNGNKVTYFGSSWVNSGQNNFFTAVLECIQVRFTVVRGLHGSQLLITAILRYKSCQVYFVTAFCGLDGSEVTHYCSIVV